MVGLANYLLLSAVLFALGLFGVLTRRNAIAILMSIELMLNAVNINLVAFSRYLNLQGQVFAIFVITVAAAESVVGLALILSIYKNKDTILVDRIDLLKW